MNPIKNDNGRLELFIGPMFASKSTELIKAARRYKSIGKNILAINHKINNRYDTTNIVTHDKDILDDCIVVEFLTEIYEEENEHYEQFLKSDIIIIEELQFFIDAFNFVTKSVDVYGKIVIVAGLAGDYKREPFGDVLRLIPHADKVKKLSALCKICMDGTHAHFVKKVCAAGGQIMVGGSELFLPVCRKHYLN